MRPLGGPYRAAGYPSATNCYKPGRLAAIRATRRGRRRTDQVVELEFSFDDPAYPFVGASAAENCTVELEEMVPRGEGAYAEFFSVRGADVERIVDLAADHGTISPTTLERYDDGGLVEFTVSDDCPAVGLAELGALPLTVSGDDGEGRIVAQLPPEYDAEAVTAAFLREFDCVLVAKRHRERLTPAFSRREFGHAVEDRLTDRQFEVLKAAFESGYYDWPRGRTGKALAAELDISPSTFSEHLSTAERTLLSLLFERTE